MNNAPETVSNTECEHQSEEMGEDGSQSPNGLLFKEHSFNRESDKKKRSRRSVVADDSGLDDILNSITSKLDNLSTNPDERKEESIKAFIEVLGCSENDASFYLESSAWDIETSLSLWFENNPSQSSLYTSSSSSSGGMVSNRPEGGWVRRDVVIEGLDPEWKASVSRSSGQIYFIHLPTGISQQCVPPGFADNSNSKTAPTNDGSVEPGADMEEDGIKLTSTDNFSVFDIGSCAFSNGSNSTGGCSSRANKRSSRPSNRKPSYTEPSPSVFDPYYMIPATVIDKGSSSVSTSDVSSEFSSLTVVGTAQAPPDMDTSESRKNQS